MGVSDDLDDLFWPFLQLNAILAAFRPRNTRLQGLFQSKWRGFPVPLKRYRFCPCHAKTI